MSNESLKEKEWSIKYQEIIEEKAGNEVKMLEKTINSIDANGERTPTGGLEPNPRREEK